ncbi:single-stranded-DNA-specific exonuclease [Meinhardsimonia xiamenensis]|jgi:single-stranded-DNA-specific exonuclease|uniref:Single-stranded-DNA-specific exonuclease RecJ n=1 Tax=Meinhardsimonia xiamenensis TaxID=990712 RepID=A0A1G9D6C1_9RHOB|nr:single-stranded-DNA-specific exonuclease RecJ [Meinhardsimonia xiamenensis]PRX38113.1 single-stranded-DNA-specific exonuclease [Meinhardsimonia xiamenensis]SDK59466.1 single-stranded-DNA-specific exonuclease [Meinhardsimonia xiamenensis]
MKPFLGVERSLTGRRWLGPGEEAMRLAEAIAQATGLPLAVCGVLASRGVSAHLAEGWLSPRLRELLPDPRSLRDVKQAAERLIAAVTRGERIAIFADYDVDGAASAALLIDWLRAMGLDATLYVPDRIDEGYGPNAPAMAGLARTHDLIVCVDAGTLSHEAIAAAQGADVIVLDHHLGGETLPPALAVVNPNRQDEDGALSHLCAAAVVFLVLVEAGRQLRAAGRAGPDLMGMLDLVALATVADVAPLVGVNRAFVRQGLSVMARRARPGLVALCDTARLDRAPTAYHLGYVLGPRINAGGRVGTADLGARLLATADPSEAAAIAERLEALNEERRAIESAVREEALAQAEARGLDAPLVWAAGEGWHPGVVGIVASRLKEAANRPAVVIGLDGGEGKGSGRSAAGIDLGAAVHRLAAEGLLLKGGGHPMAAGLTVAREKLESAMERLSELLARQGADRLGAADLRLSGLLAPAAATPELVEMLEQAGPYGAGAPAPRFAFADCRIHFSRQVGSDHLKIGFSDGTGPRLEAIAFNAATGPLGAALSAHAGARFHLAGRLEINDWGGRRRVELRLEDAAPAAS